MNWLQRRISGFRELRNWFYIRKLIKKNKDSEEWKKFGLRAGYVGQIYCVVSLRKEDMGEEEMVQRMKIIQRLEPINNYLNSLDLSEIVYPEIVEIPESRSWLVVYWPIWQYFSFWRLIFQTVGLFIAIKLWSAIGMTEMITSLISKF